MSKPVKRRRSSGENAAKPAAKAAAKSAAKTQQNSAAEAKKGRKTPPLVQAQAKSGASVPAEQNGEVREEAFAAQHLLDQFRDVADASLRDVAFDNVDADWMRLNELKFLLYNVRELSNIALYQSLSRTNTLTTSVEKTKRNCIDKQDLLDRITILDEKIEEVNSLIRARLEATVRESRLPRILQLCEKYRLNDKEADLLHLMTIVQGSNDRDVLDTLVEDDYYRRMLGFQRLTGVSEVDVDRFCDDTRPHIKEGLVTVEEEGGVHLSIRISRTAVMLLYGRTVSDDDLLKVFQTALEDILKLENNPALSNLLTREENKDFVDDSGVAATALSIIRNEKLLLDELEQLELPLRRSLSNVSLQGTTTTSARKGRRSSTESTRSSKRKRSVTRKEKDVEHDLDESVDTASVSKDDISSVTADMDTSTSNVPYSDSDQLEYLEECFQSLGLMIRSSAARMKDDMKKEGTRMNSWDIGGDVKHGRRELQAKLRVHENKITRRLAVTRDQGVPLPRLEVLAERLGLDSFEKKIILLIIGKTVSPVVKTLLDTLETSGMNRVVDDAVTVGQALSILCDNFQSQVSRRMYFYKSGRLIKHGIISLSRSRWHQGSGDLTDQRIMLDRRILDWAVGLDSEINELVEGSDLYDPKVKLTQVVLPEEQKQLVLEQCRAYDAFMVFRTKVDLDVTLPYGNGLVIMLCGPSGTGKTMTVNAVANELKKKVLLVDFPSLTGRKGEGDLDADLRGLFREAQMNNAILFFDECDAVFRSRDIGGDRLLNSLLTEIERHQGIVFLATNRPYDLDEAMHRRITTVIEYRAPDHSMRKQIWTTLLETTKIPVGPDIDLDAIAVKYELTGGFIKNAVLSALLRAISRNNSDPLVMQEDLVAGCKLQMRGSLRIRADSERAIPDHGLDNLILSEPHKRVLEKFIRFEKARSIVYGTWGGSDENRIEPTASIMLLVGPSGSGKRTIAKAVGYDLGRPVKITHVANVMSSSLSESMRTLDALASDARLMDAVLVLDGFEGMLEDVQSVGDAWKLQMVLARLIEKLHSFAGAVILLAHLDNPTGLSLQRELASKLFSVVKMVVPPHDSRAKLWRRLLPERIPLASDVDFEALGRKFDLHPSNIAAAAVRAAAEAAMREPAESRVVSQADLVAAGSEETKRMKGTHEEFMERLFV